MIDKALLGLLDVESLLFLTRIVVETNDGFVLEIYDVEDCEEWRLDVCQVVWMLIDGVGTGIDDENDGGVLKHHLVDGGGWKMVEELELMPVEVMEVG